jgi:hypothetical protein
MALCEQKLGAFLKQRGLGVWDYRLLETDPVLSDIRFRVLAAANGRCALCGATSQERRIEVDHVIPRSKGGSNDVSNLQALCDECNRGQVEQRRHEVLITGGLQVIDQHVVANSPQPRHRHDGVRISGEGSEAALAVDPGSPSATGARRSTCHLVGPQLRGDRHRGSVGSRAISPRMSVSESRRRHPGLKRLFVSPPRDDEPLVSLIGRSEQLETFEAILAVDSACSGRKPLR